MKKLLVILFMLSLSLSAWGHSPHAGDSTGLTDGDDEVAVDQKPANLQDFNQLRNLIAESQPTDPKEITQEMRESVANGVANQVADVIEHILYIRQLGDANFYRAKYVEKLSRELLTGADLGSEEGIRRVFETFVKFEVYLAQVEESLSLLEAMAKPHFAHHFYIIDKPSGGFVLHQLAFQGLRKHGAILHHSLTRLSELFDGITAIEGQEVTLKADYVSEGETGRGQVVVSVETMNRTFSLSEFRGLVKRYADRFMVLVDRMEAFKPLQFYVYDARTSQPREVVLDLVHFQWHGDRENLQRVRAVVAPHQSTTRRLTRRIKTSRLNPFNWTIFQRRDPHEGDQTPYDKPPAAGGTSSQGGGEASSGRGRASELEIACEAYPQGDGTAVLETPVLETPLQSVSRLVEGVRRGFNAAGLTRAEAAQVKRVERGEEGGVRRWGLRDVRAGEAHR